MKPENVHVLIVEDMISVRRWQKNQLEKLGYQHFYEASNGKEALHILETQFEQKCPIHLILCDWYMPEISGIELLQTIRKKSEFSQLPFIMISAESRPELVLEAIKTGAHFYITKPCTFENLQDKLQLVWK